MSEKSIFDQIKKQNGENFAKAVRAYDNGIFDIPNIVDILKYAGRDAEPIMQYLISLKNIKIEENGNTKDPFELLSDAGYDAYYVTNLEEQNRISKYFERDEMLCTFRDPTRFQRYHIINAVKKNVDEIKREDFKGKEQREDSYGTSVISIQIATGGGFISIKNRYNHTVSNPDNTFNSNPDTIIIGLSNSLKRYFQVDFSSYKVSLPNKFININNQIVRYHLEMDNIYFGDSFYAKDGNIFQLNKDTELMLDTCIFNIRDRTLYDPTVCRKPILIDNIQEESGSFLSILAHELKGKKLQITKGKDGEHTVCANGEVVITEKNGEITALNLPNTITVGDDFLHFNKTLQTLNAPKLTVVGHSFLYCNKSLQTLILPNLTRVGDNFLNYNNSLQNLDIPNLTMVGRDFMYYNETLQRLDFPNLTTVGDDFLHLNKTLQSLNAPKLTTVGNYFLCGNEGLQTLDLPNLTTVGRSFLLYNNSLQNLYLPNLTTVKDNFLYYNRILQHFDFPNLTTVGNCFLCYNEAFKKFVVSSLEKRRIKKVSTEKASGSKSSSRNDLKTVKSSSDKKPDALQKNIMTLLFREGKSRD